jgi:hypothetical protein
MDVRNFLFWNGRAALLDGKANFTVDFVKWTEEPGIALCKKPDGKLVKVPDFALEGFNPAEHPRQEEISQRADE